MIFDAITWNVDPEIFSIGQLSIRWYGLLFASAFLSGYIVFTRYLATERLTSEMLDQLLDLYCRWNSDRCQAWAIVSFMNPTTF